MAKSADNAHVAHDALTHCTFAGLFDENDSGRTVARRRGDDVTASEFRERILEWRKTLERMPNRNVAIFDEEGVDFAAALIGALSAGKIAYLSGDTLAATCRALSEHDVVFVGSFPDEWLPITEPSGAHVNADLKPLNADDAELVIFTSGTTGAPQALPKRLSQLLAEVRTLESMFGARLGECDMFATISHQHIYGLLFKILWPIVARRPFVSETVALPEEMVMHLSRRRSAVISGPAQLKRLPPSLGWHAVRDNVATVFSSGGPLPLVVSASVETMLGSAPIEIYGSSETGGIAWRESTGGIERSWSPLDGVTVREIGGRLSVRSPHLADSEWRALDDAATLEANGRFVLHGRTDRIAKIEGKRVSLGGIELALADSPLVADARVIVLTHGDASARDEIGCVIVPSEEGWTLLRSGGARAIRRALAGLLRESTEHIAIPRRWRWLDEVPTNTAGKTTNEALTRIFASMSVHAPAAHVLDLSADRAMIEIYVSPHLECLDGHFPGGAVLPGAAQLDWAAALGQRCFRMSGPFTHMNAVKFHRVYLPGAMLSLELEWEAERDALSFRFSSRDGLHSNGRMYFGR